MLERYLYFEIYPTPACDRQFNNFVPFQTVRERSNLVQIADPPRRYGTKLDKVRLFLSLLFPWYGSDKVWTDPRRYGSKRVYSQVLHCGSKTIKTLEFLDVLVLCFENVWHNLKSLRTCPSTNIGCGEKEGGHSLVHVVPWIGSTRYSSYLDKYWPCAGGFSVVIAIVHAIAWHGTLGTYPMVHGGFDGKGKESRKQVPDLGWVWGMSGLTGIRQPNQTHSSKLRRERGRGKSIGKYTWWMTRRSKIMTTHSHKPTKTHNTSSSVNLHGVEDPP